MGFLICVGAIAGYTAVFGTICHFMDKKEEKECKERNERFKRELRELPEEERKEILKQYGLTEDYLK